MPSVALLPAPASAQSALYSPGTRPVIHAHTTLSIKARRGPTLPAEDQHSVLDRPQGGLFLSRSETWGLLAVVD